MSKIYFLFFFLFLTLSKFTQEKSIFWEITFTEELIKFGDSGEAFLTINLADAPKDIIDFENTVIIGIDLEKEDPSFKAKVHKYKSTKDEEVYKIDFKSERKGKNKFIITLYDFENQKSYILDDPDVPVEFEIGEKEVIIEEIIPDPKKTKITEEPLKVTGENDTITFEFSLKDTNGKDIVPNDAFIKKLKIKNNDKYEEEAKITFKDKTIKVEMPSNYLPLLQKINVEFNGDKPDEKFDIFSDDLEVTIEVSPCFWKTEVICNNCDDVTLNETISMDVSLFNYKDVPVNTKDYSDKFQIMIEGPLESEEPETKKFSIKKEVDNSGDLGNLYKIITKEDDIFEYSGNYKIKVYEDDILIKEFDISLTTWDYDMNGFSLEFIEPDFDPKKAFVDTEFGMVLKGKDWFGNVVHFPLKDDVKLYLVYENGTEIKYLTKFEEEKNGDLYMYVTSETVGKVKLKIYYKKKEIKKINSNQSLPEFIFNVMKCIKSILNKDELNSVVLGKDVTVYLQCLDFLNHTIKRGGEEFSSENYIISDGKHSSFEVKIKDLQTGNYSFNFVPIREGNYYITIYLDKKFFIEITFVVEKIVCKDETPYLCPNKYLCVSNRKDCIEPKNDCPEETPFSCKVNNKEKCVESQMECDCPEGYIRCDYMKYCVPIDRPDMCANFSGISEKTCQKLRQYKILNADGICRLSKDLSPSQKVCPIGKVLCADLSCRDNYDDCAVSDKCEGQFRCPDQTCVDDYVDCPSTISCQNKKYVCPDGTCVDNEVECEGLPNCFGDEPYRCQDNLCVKDQYSCAKNVPCGQRMALCSDLICRTTCN